MKPLSSKLDHLSLIPIVFGISLCFWIYLGLITQMLIVQDAIGYEKLGSLLYQNGWVEYFRTGPNREPVFPFIISLSMKCADAFSVSYQSVQRCVHIGFLFLTQLFTLLILKRLKINKPLTAATLLYLGLSPALVNTGFSLWSEIATYPFVLLIILISSASWEKLQALQNLSRQDTKIGRAKIFLLAFLLGVVFLLLTFVKGGFEIISSVFILMFLLIVIQAIVTKNRTLFIHSTIFLLMFLSTYQTPLYLYKSANSKYNGNFTLTNRGPWALYGNTARRMQKLTSTQFKTALAYVPGEEICHKLYGQKECYFWSWHTSDTLGKQKAKELEDSGLNQHDVDKALIKLSLKKILKNPFQAGLLMGVESAKMLFWESTQIGFVVYPDWLSEIHSFKPFHYTLSSLMALLTLVSLAYAFIFLWRQRKDLFSMQGSSQSFTIAPTLTIAVCYVGLLSFFMFITRFILPVAPLFIILNAFFLQQVFFERDKK